MNGTSSWSPLYNWTHDQIQFIEQTYGITVPIPVIEDSGSVKVWKFSGFFHYNSKRPPYKLASKTVQQLMNFGNDVFGFILPYAGSEDDLPRCATPFDQTYLHLFNTGESIQLVSATVNSVAFTDVEAYPKRRTVLVLGV